MSHKLSQLLDAKVSLVRSANGKAKVTISLDEPHKLDQLIAKLEVLDEIIDLGQLIKIIEFCVKVVGL